MFNTAAEFVTALNEGFKAAGKADKAEFSIVKGRKFEKIICKNYGQGSVYCFIDADGNIFKAAGFNQPAKGIRANLKTLPEWVVPSIVEAGYGSTGWLYR